MADRGIVTVSLVGLPVGVHCLGMCGSIAGVLAAQIPEGSMRWPFLRQMTAGGWRAMCLPEVLNSTGVRNA